MSLEQQLEELNENLKALTEAVLAMAEGGEEYEEEEPEEEEEDEEDEEDEEEALPPPKKKRGGKKAGPTAADVTAKLQELKAAAPNAKKGNAMVKEALAEFEVKKVDELDESDYPELLDVIDEMLEELGEDE